MYKNNLSVFAVLLVVFISLNVVAAQDTVPDIEANRALEVLNIEAFNNADWDLVRETVAEDFVLYQPLSPEPIVSEDGLVGFFQSFYDSMPDINHPNINVLLAEGEWVVVLMPGAGTFENDMMGIPANNAQISTYFLNFWHVQDGEMVEAYFNFDTLDMLTQMGAVPVAEDAPTIERSVEPMEIVIYNPAADLEANKAIVQSFNDEIVNNKNLDMIPELVTEDWIYHDRADVHAVTYTGYEGVAQWTGPFFAMLPDLEIAPENFWLFAEGDLVAARWVGTGTHTGDVPGIPASGNEIVLSGAALHRIEDGKIAETWFVMDTLGFMAQIGMIPES